MNTPLVQRAARLLAVLAAGAIATCPTSAKAAFPDLRLVPVSAGEMIAPVEISHAGDGSGRLFIADQLGTIRILETGTGTLLSTPFLDLSAKLVPLMTSYDERGLMGLAFHPDYANNGKFYVHYSALKVNPGTPTEPVDHRSVIEEYTVSAGDPNVADPLSGRIVLTYDQPQFNHNGGDLCFGPDGMLYISSGDGGGADDNGPGHTGGSSSRPPDALGNSQDRTNLLGKILRIDPLGSNGPGGQYGIPVDNPFVGEGGGIREEIFAYGLRNPWKMAFDPPSGRLFAGDVGQNMVEEINVVTSGGNYGWRNKEGTFDFAPSAPGTGPFIDPIAQYAHPAVTIGDPALPVYGLSVTGGEVYRGTAVPGLQGKYVFADWSSDFGAPGGTMLGLEETAPGVFAMSKLTISGGNPIEFFITAFGSDEQGELYVAARTASGPRADPFTGRVTGTIFRIAPAVQQNQVTLSADQDTSLYEELPGNSSGAGVTLFSGVTGPIAENKLRHALVRFDLAPIPSGVSVTSAEVRLNVSFAMFSAGDLALHRLTSDWGEGTSDAGATGGTGVAATAGDATWSHAFFDTTPWTAPGGDYVSTASASRTPITIGQNSWTSTQLRQDVQDWIDIAQPNYGWLLRDRNTEPSAKRIDSREATNPAVRPRLIVNYGVLPAVPVLLGLSAASDTGASATDGITKVNQPTILGYAPLGATVRIYANGVEVGNQVVSTLPFAITPAAGLSDGVKSITATGTENGVVSAFSEPLSITIDTVPPNPGVLDLVAASDSGASSSDNITNDNTPTLITSGGSGDTFQFSSDLAGVIGSGPGMTPVTMIALADGIHQITAVATGPDLAGNNGMPSSPIAVTIDTSPPAPPTSLDLLPVSDSGASDSDNETSARSLQISGLAETGSTVTLVSNLNGTAGTGTGAGATPWTIITSILSSGTHEISAIATDAAGNQSAPSDPLTVVIIDPREVTPVTLPSSQVASPSATTVSFSANLVDAVGTYDGLLRELGDDEEVIGAVSGLVISRTGAVSGRVRVNGRSLPFRTTISPGGEIQMTALIQGASLVLNLQLQQTAVGGFVLRGPISWGATVAQADISRAPYHAKLNPLASPFPGVYTMLIPSESAWPSTEPAGDGWARVTISPAGTVSVSGALGDGVSLTEAAYVSADLEINLFTELYRVTLDGNRGYVGGRLVLESIADQWDFAGRLIWKKFADSREARYPSTFTLTPWAIGGKFVPPARGERALALDNTEYNAELSFIGTAAPATANDSLERAMTWRTDNRLVHYGPQSLSGAVSAANGGLNGSFSDPVTRERIGFRGVAFQPQNIAAGNFVNGSFSGSLRIRPDANVSYPGREAAGALAEVQTPSSPANAPTESEPDFTAAAAGRYNGVLTQSGTISGGLENLSLLSTRSFTGTLWVEGTRYALRQVLEANGDVTFDVPRPSPLTALTVELRLTMIDGSTDGFGLTGTVTIDGITHVIDAQRLPAFARTNPAPEAGAYTLALREPDGNNPTAQPGGDGYGLLTVAVTGACSGSVTLPDGTRATLAGHVARRYSDAGTETAEWSFHRGLYGRSPKGYVAGKLTFRLVDSISDVDGDWRWVKLAGALPVGGYPSIDGTRKLVGSRYQVPLAGVRAMEGLAEADFNIWLRFLGPDLSSKPDVTITTLDRAATWSLANRLLYYGPERVKLSFNFRNGLITGSFVDTPSGVSVAFGGVLLQRQDLVTGSYRAQGFSGLFSIEPR